MRTARLYAPYTIWVANYHAVGAAEKVAARDKINTSVDAIGCNMARSCNLRLVYNISARWVWGTREAWFSSPFYYRAQPRERERGRTRLTSMKKYTKFVLCMHAYRRRFAACDDEKASGIYTYREESLQDADGGAHSSPSAVLFSSGHIGASCLLYTAREYIYIPGSSSFF